MSGSPQFDATLTDRMPLEIRLLGPLKVSRGGETVSLGGARSRALLALLCIQRVVVSRDRIVDELWGESPPATAPHMVEVYVSKLRGLLGAEVLVTRSPGYMVDVHPQHIDIARFEGLVAEGREAREAGQPETAAARLAEALALWRGSALSDFTYEPFAQGEIARLEELRLVTEEKRIDAELALGTAPELVGELERLIAAAPFRERFRGQLMLALYRAGRQADALEAYRQTRQTLVEELGVEPGKELRALERAILAQEESLTGEPRARSQASAEESRRIITLLFGELAVGGPEADPEALQQLTRRLLSTAETVLEHHGGAVKYLPDGTLMGVFGTPPAHEDDALRSLRAAVELRDEGIVRRAALETGEVLASENLKVSGPAVRRAARLLATASAGEILVGQATRRLTAHAARFGQPIQLDESTAWSLVGLTFDASARPIRLDVPLVGREDELRELRDACARAIHDQEPRLVTVIGEPGVGKSRLARSLAEELEDLACVAVGRCLEYGEGITYWPLREIVRSLAAEDTAEELATLVAGAHEADAIARRVAAAVGFGNETHPVGEISWAARRFFETLARQRPLILVVEDIHWAEPMFLDLLEQVMKDSERVPMFVLCTARPELREQRPDWGGLGERQGVLELAGLTRGDARELVSRLDPGMLSGDQREHVIEAADGNPLFLEQLIAFALEGQQTWEDLDFPPSLRALLAARLDRLGPGERTTLECAAVIGREFWVGAVAELLPTDAGRTLPRHLQSLRHKGLVEPGHSALPFEEAFRFRHVLLREAIHRSVSKERRAQLHERLAGWLERAAGERVNEYEEILGYHLEQSVRYRAELGLVDEDARALGMQAARRLASAGRRALARGDVDAANNLLERAANLLPAASRERMDILPDLVESYVTAGRFDAAEALVEEGLETAETLGDHLLSTVASLQRAWLKSQADLRGWSEQALSEAEQAIPVLERYGDDRALARAWEVVWAVQATRGRLTAARTAAEHGLQHAERAGDVRQQGWQRILRIASAHFGFAPLDEVEEEAGRDLDWARETGSLGIEALIVQVQGMQQAARGNLVEGNELIARSNSTLSELGMKSHLAGTVANWIPFVTDDPVTAEAHLRESFEALADAGEKLVLSTVAACLAEAIYAQGRYDEAEEMLSVGATASAADDVSTQVGVRSLRAKLLARRGMENDAEALAREAVALAGETDYVDLRGDSLVALGEVLRLTGRSAEAAEAMQAAIDLWEAKGNVLFAGRTRALLGELEAPSRSR